MRIFAVDPSLARCGTCGTADTGVYVTSFGTEPVGPKLSKRSQVIDWFRRIDNVTDHVLSVAEYAKPDLIVIEGMVIGSTPGSAGSMWLHGILRHELLRIGVPLVEISAQGLKKFAVGDLEVGLRDKDAMQHRARDLGSPARNNDEADAWWLWKMAETAAHNSPDEVSAFRAEALGAVEWPHPLGEKWPKKKPAAKKRKPKVVAPVKPDLGFAMEDGSVLWIPQEAVDKVAALA
jgi:Holliday junction resolvasome RuvABC endonuclease subunit